jgi:hypothetical protein
MKYQENKYFNNEDEFLIHDSSLRLNFISKLHFYNGVWYSNSKLKYKMTSVKSVNINLLFE